jgi:hypothetical protein
VLLFWGVNEVSCESGEICNPVKDFVSCSKVVKASVEFTTHNHSCMMSSLISFLTGLSILRSCIVSLYCSKRYFLKCLMTNVVILYISYSAHSSCSFCRAWSSVRSNIHRQILVDLIVEARFRCISNSCSAVSSRTCLCCLFQSSNFVKSNIRSMILLVRVIEDELDGVDSLFKVGEFD